MVIWQAFDSLEEIATAEACPEPSRRGVEIAERAKLPVAVAVRERARSMGGRGAD